MFLSMAHAYIHNLQSWAAWQMSKGLHGQRWMWHRHLQPVVWRPKVVCGCFGCFFFFLNRIHPGVGTTAPSESHLWEHDSSSHPILNSLRFGLKLWFVSQKIPWIRGLISCYSLEGEHLLGPEFLLASWLFSNQSIVLVILELLLIPGLEDNSFSLILGI